MSQRGRPRRPSKRKGKKEGHSFSKDLSIGLLCLIVIVQFIFIIMLFSDINYLTEEVASLQDKLQTRTNAVEEAAYINKKASVKKAKKPSSKKDNVGAATQAVPLARTGKQPFIAIILDDWGYTDELNAYLQMIDYPFTVSILPGHPFSRSVHDIALRSGKEIFIHIPCEPEEIPKSKWEKDTLLVDMPAGEIRSRLDRFRKELPNAVGANNHMGSKFTQAEDPLMVLLKWCKDNNLIFVDSYSTAKSRVRKAAGALGMKYIRRMVFIDNVLDENEILAQIERGVAIAQKKGYAVLIGHARKKTLETLLGIKDRFKKWGVVPVSVQRLYNERL